MSSTLKREMEVLCSLTITAFSVILAAVCVFKFVLNKGKYHPVAGTAIDHLLNFNRLFDYMKEMASKYKTYRILHLFRIEVYTSDPANVEYILKTNFPNYGKGGYNYDKLNDLLGDGIFTVDGEKWRNQRKISSYEFSTKNLRDFSSAVFTISAVKLAHKVSEAVTSNQAIEIQDLFTKSTLETVFKILLGVDLDTTTEEGILFSTSFDEANAATAYRFVDVFWKVKRYLNIGSEANMKKCIKVVEEFVYKIIRNKIEKMSKSRDNSTVMKKSDILSRFLEMNKTDPKYLKDIILSFIIAGKDTTASTLSWFFYMMCKHPLRQMKIFSAVLLGTFRFKLSDEQRRVKYKTMLTLHIDGGLHLHASRNEEAFLNIFLEKIIMSTLEFDREAKEFYRKILI